MQQFLNQIVLVTGAASGLGAAIAQKLIQSGATVALVDINLEALKPLATQFGENALPFQMNITDEMEVQNVMQSILEKLGKIDILVNAAGITGQTNTPTQTFS